MCVREVIYTCPIAIALFFWVAIFGYHSDWCFSVRNVITLKSCFRMFGVLPYFCGLRFGMAVYLVRYFNLFDLLWVEFVTNWVMSVELYFSFSLRDSIVSFFLIHLRIPTMQSNLFTVRNKTEICLTLFFVRKLTIILLGVCTWMVYIKLV